MKKTLLLLISFAVLSCNKDPQEKLCKDIICLNGGTCVNGACECPPQYTGPSCSQEVTPVKLRVAKIKLTDFPATDTGGAGWDLFDGADVYLAIYKNGVKLLQTIVVDDLTTDHEWAVNFEFSEPAATYDIYVYDYDDAITADDFMGGMYFTPYKSGLGFPTSYSINCGACIVAFEFNGVTYFH